MQPRTCTDASFPLLPTQQMLFVAARELRPDTIETHRSSVIEITGELNIDRFREALAKVMDLHEILSASLKEENGEKRFVPDPTAVLPFEYIDARTTTLVAPEDSDLTLVELGQEAFLRTPFKLSSAPLWRSLLLRVSDRDELPVYRFILIFDHAITDAPSIINNFYQPLAEAYNYPDRPLIKPHSFATFSIEPPNKDERKAHQKARLESYEPLPLPFEPDFSSYEPGFHRLQCKIPEAMVAQFTNLRERVHEKIKKISKGKPLSTNAIITTAVNATLYGLTRKKTICIGSTSGNRLHEGIDVLKHFNCFFNVLLSLYKINDSTTVIDFFQQIIETTRNDLADQLPLDEVHALLSDHHNTTSSLFNFMLVINNKYPDIRLEGTRVSIPIELRNLGHYGATTNFPLGMNVEEDGSSFLVTLQYHKLWKESTIQRFFNRFLHVLQQIIDRPEQRFEEIQYLLPDEMQLYHDFNNTRCDDIVPFPTTLLARYAATIPDRRMMVFHPENGCDPEIWTYRNAHDYVTRLANYLTDTMGITPGNRVGLCLPRSPLEVLARFAIWQAGGVIVPLSTRNTERTFSEIQHCGVTLTLTHEQTQDLLAGKRGKKLNLSDPLLSLGDATYRELELPDDAPAYINYTSDTSHKRPKAALISRATVKNNFVLTIQKRTDLPEHVSMIGAAPDWFDAKYHEFMVPFSKQGEYHFICEDKRFDATVIARIIHQYNIYMVSLVPSILEELSRQPKELLSSVGLIVSMGDKFRDIFGNFPEAAIILNEYGVTEAGVFQTIGDKQHRKQIGTPICNTAFWPLDPITLTISPPGTDGILFITGPCVMLRYVNNHTLTETSIHWTMPRANGQGFYRVKPETPGATPFVMVKGDIVTARINEDTQRLGLECIRNKPKIDGVLIPIHELATEFREHLAMIQAIELALTPAGLKAYVFPTHADVDSKKIQQAILDYLMTEHRDLACLPKRIVVTEKPFPLTAAGKVDIYQLALDYPDVEKIYIPPETDLQTSLQAVLIDFIQGRTGKRLSPEIVSIDRSLQELGLPSITWTPLKDKIKEVLGLKSLPILFTPMTTIQNLATALEIERDFLLKCASASPYGPGGPALLAAPAPIGATPHGIETDQSLVRGSDIKR